jgi:protein TonB
LLLHVLVIGAVLFVGWPSPPQEDFSSPGVSVVFDNGGAQQNTAPKAQPGPSTPAQAPPPGAPQPPPSAQSQTEESLNLPSAPLANLQSAPQQQPPQPQRQVVRPRPQPAPKYVMMSTPSFASPTPPAPQAKQALSMNLPQSDADAVNAPEIQISGDVGADWQEALNKWVDAHKYYPQAALEQQQQGNVEIKFTVDRAGNVTGLQMVNSSGSPFLDQAWYGLFTHNKLPPFPAGTKADSVTIDATMHFILEQ